MPLLVNMLTFEQVYRRVCQLGPRNSPRTVGIAVKGLLTLTDELGLVMTQEPFMAKGDQYANLCYGSTQKFVLMAHYDTAGPTCGGCDNSSGLAVALWTAYLLKEIGNPVGLVLNACEEPPFFSYRMGSEAWAEVHEPATTGKILVIDSLGYAGPGCDIATAHPSVRSVLDRELVFLGTKDDTWLNELATDLAIPAFVDLSNNLVRQLGDTRNLAGYKSVLVLDSATMAVPFHTGRDVPEYVDVTWLNRVAEDFARVLNTHDEAS